jgi:hypothetical protein
MKGSPSVIAAGALHDVGKPIVKTTEIVDGKEKLSFEGHAEAGRKAVLDLPDDIFAKYSLDKDYIARLVLYHDAIMFGARPIKSANCLRATENMLEGLVAELSGIPIDQEDLIMLFLADINAQGDCATDKEFMLSIARYLVGEATEQDVYHQRDRIRLVLV